MVRHSHIHRRNAQAFAFPDPAAIAQAIPDPAAIANAIPDAFADPNASPDASPAASPDAAPAASPEPAASPAAQQTIYSIVYKTASATFDGPIAGYSTEGVAAPTSNTPAAVPAATPTTKAPAPVETTSKAAAEAATTAPLVVDTTKQSHSASATPASSHVDSELPASIVPTSSVPTTLAILAATSSLASLAPTPTLSSSDSTDSTTNSAASSTPSASSSSDGGMSAGGKAGLAIGILLLVGTAFALIFFFYKKRRDATRQQQRLDDEKTEMFATAQRSPSTRTNPNAPQLSLRPVTEFAPYGKRQSKGNLLPLQTTLNSAQEGNRNNPFGAHADVIDSANANGPAEVNDIGPTGEIVATGAAAGAAAGLARKASKLEAKPQDFTARGPMGPPSPSGTVFSATSEAGPAPVQQTGTGAAIAAAGGPQNSAVHRVQLDFKPSMEDELELRAGQLIRLLHEYDDGWALCIRLDRSAQGVVPRTCLSTRPVKPRPQQNGPRGPPPGMRAPPPNQPRGMSPNGPMQQGARPMSPAGARPNSPANRPNSPAMNQGRPQSPAGGQPRSPSVQGGERRNSPPAPSPMNPVVGSPPNSVSRKPVGQAL